MAELGPTAGTLLTEFRNQCAAARSEMKRGLRKMREDRELGDVGLESMGLEIARSTVAKLRLEALGKFCSDRLFEIYALDEAEEVDQLSCTWGCRRHSRWRTQDRRGPSERRQQNIVGTRGSGGSNDGRRGRETDN